jgi:hypothetical protein
LVSSKCQAILSNSCTPSTPANTSKWLIPRWVFCEHEEAHA